MKIDNVIIEYEDNEANAQWELWYYYWYKHALELKK